MLSSMKETLSLIADIVAVLGIPTLVITGIRYLRARKNYRFKLETTINKKQMSFKTKLSLAERVCAKLVKDIAKRDFNSKSIVVEVPKWWNLSPKWLFSPSMKEGKLILEAQRFSEQQWATKSLRRFFSLMGQTEIVNIFSDFKTISPKQIIERFVDWYNNDRFTISDRNKDKVCLKVQITGFDAPLGRFYMSKEAWVSNATFKDVNSGELCPVSMPPLINGLDLQNREQYKWDIIISAIFALTSSDELWENDQFIEATKAQYISLPMCWTIGEG